MPKIEKKIFLILSSDVLLCLKLKRNFLNDQETYPQLRKNLNNDQQAFLIGGPHTYNYSYHYTRTLKSPSELSPD